MKGHVVTHTHTHTKGSRKCWRETVPNVSLYQALTFSSIFFARWGSFNGSEHPTRWLITLSLTPHSKHLQLSKLCIIFSSSKNSKRLWIWVKFGTIDCNCSPLWPWSRANRTRRAWQVVCSLPVGRVCVCVCVLKCVSVWKRLQHWKEKTGWVRGQLGGG